MINSLNGAEISSILGDNTLLVLIQSGSFEEKNFIFQMIEKVDGVISVVLAYDHYERNDSKERGCKS